MMNEYKSMSQEKAFVTKTLRLLKQYDEILSDLPNQNKLEITLRLNCMLGLLVVPQQKINNSRAVKLGETSIWGINLNQVEIFPKLTKDYSDGNDAGAIAYYFRNSICHNKFAIVSEDDENITHVVFEDFTSRKPRELTFRLEISVENLEKFVTRYYDNVLPFLDNNSHDR